MIEAGRQVLVRAVREVAASLGSVVRYRNVVIHSWRTTSASLHLARVHSLPWNVHVHFPCIRFPGLESVTAAETSNLLEEAQVAVSTGTEIPAELGEIEIAPVDSGHEVTPSAQSSGPVMQLASSIRDVASILPMVSAPVGTTPSQYLSYGGAISNNRAWQWDAGFNVYRCNTTCTLTDRRSLRTTITPYQNRVRIEQQPSYSPNNGGISTPRITGKVYIPSAPARGTNTANVGLVFTTWYIDTPNLWTYGTKIIVGIEQRADTRTGEQAGLYRTLTATCFPAPKSYCAWFV